MNSLNIRDNIIKGLPFDATKEQKEVIEDISDFITTIGNRSIFMLKGYAGTGKTTLISRIIQYLPLLGKKSILLAPTGKAAKVLSKYSKKIASTIHKEIYWIQTNKNGNTIIKPRENPNSNTIFIVDEASMITNASDTGFGNRSVLDDLIKYIYEGYDCKLILIGDTAQLPPVNIDMSPALDKEKLESSYYKQVISRELTKVVRHEEGSNILVNATTLRNRIKNSIYTYPKLTTNANFLRIKDGLDLHDKIESSYNSDAGINNTIIICRSNKKANLYNQQIRNKIRWQEDEISSGDRIMIVRNNYFWTKNENNNKIKFIANGDTAEICRITEIIDIYGLRFARANIKMLEYPEEKELDVIILLDTLKSESASMNYEQYLELYKNISIDYKGEKNIAKKVKENRFLNALQIKFAYAITGHKSQGGQWENVFIDTSYFSKAHLNRSYLRWLYTAITRAKKRVYLINFDDQFFL